MSKNLKKITIAAGLSLALAFTISSCSKEDAAELVCLQQGLTYDSDLGLCKGAAGANGQCPVGSSLSEDGKWCTADAVEGGSPADAGVWLTYDDGLDGGTSTIKASENNGAITVEGKLAYISSAMSWGFVGWINGDAALLAKAKDEAYTSITFKANGDGKTYKVQFPTEDISNYDYYSATFKTTKNETKNVVLCLDDFEQGGWDSDQIKPFSREEITAIEFGAHTDITKTGAFGPLTISNLSFGKGSCKSTESSSTTNPPATGDGMFCDYGFPSTDDNAGCYEHSAEYPCDTRYGKIVSVCGTAGFSYCDYGPINQWGGGCYKLGDASECDLEYGELVSKCPASSL